MNKPKAMEMLYKLLADNEEFNSEILMYGNVIGKFGNWETVL